jgi:hypothetical protein
MKSIATEAVVPDPEARELPDRWKSALPAGGRTTSTAITSIVTTSKPFMVHLLGIIRLPYYVSLLEGHAFSPSLLLFYLPQLGHSSLSRPICRNRTAHLLW